MLAFARKCSVCIVAEQCVAPEVIGQIQILIAGFLGIMAATACSHEHTEGDGHEHGTITGTEEHDSHEGHDHGSPHDGHSEHGAHEEGIHLTKEQVKTVGIQLGGFSQVKLNDYISAVGTLGLPPNAYSGVTAKTAGIVRGNNKYVEGEHIEKGMIIAYVQNPDIILKQQEYLESIAELQYLRLDLQRHESLVEGNAGVLKTLQKRRCFSVLKN